VLLTPPHIHSNRAPPQDHARRPIGAPYNVLDVRGSTTHTCSIAAENVPSPNGRPQRHHQSLNSISESCPKTRTTSSCSPGRCGLGGSSCSRSTETHHTTRGYESRMCRSSSRVDYRRSLPFQVSSLRVRLAACVTREDMGL